MRSYTTKQACEVLQCTKIQLGQFGDRSKAKIEKNTWDREKLMATLAIAQTIWGQEFTKVFKEANPTTVLDWDQIKAEYNLIQKKESSLSKKDREEIIYLWEKRIRENPE